MSSACQWCVGGKCRGSVIGRIGPGLTVDGSAVLDDARKLPDHQPLTIFAEAGSTVVVNLDSRPDRGVDSRGMDGRAGGADGAGEAASLARTEPLTLDNEIALWTRHLEANDYDPRTCRQYGKVIRDVARAGRWGSSMDFTREGVVAYLTDLRLAGRSAKTHNNHRSIIGKFLEYRAPAIFRRCFKEDGVATARVRGQRGAKRAMTLLEAPHFIEIVRLEERKRPTMPTRSPVYEFAMIQGLRRGVLGDYYGVGDCLRVADLELGDDPKVRVRAALDKGGQERVLPLSDRAAVLLRKQVRGKPKDARVFDTIPTAATFQRDIARAGIEAETLDGKASFHSLRYTFNSLMAAAGIPLEIRQILMCHSSSAVTDRVYRDDRLLWDRLREAANAVPALLNPPVLGQNEGSGKKMVADRQPISTMNGLMTPIATHHARASETCLPPAAIGVKADQGGRVSVTRGSQDRPAVLEQNGVKAAGNEWAQQDSNLLRSRLTAPERGGNGAGGVPEGWAGLQDISGLRAGVDSGGAHIPAQPGSTPGPAIAAEERSGFASSLGQEARHAQVTDDRTPREGTESLCPAPEAGLPYPVVATGRTPCATADSAYGGAGSIPAGVTSTDAYARFVGEAVAAAWAARRNGGAL